MKKRRLAIIAVCIILFIAYTAIRRPEKKESYMVGICQFVQHDSLDAATQGFKDALTDKLGDKVVFEEQNGQGDYAVCTSAINGLVSKNVDLILANSTAALQAAATCTTKIPILGTSITDYSAALQLTDFDGTLDRNISGVSDLAPLDEQAAIIKELFPDADKVGLLYCSSEPNSQYQVEIVEKELEKLGFSYESYLFADSIDISSITMKAASECDVIYVPTDNAVASNAELIANICIPNKIPVIAGDESTCKVCGAASFAISYYDLGYTTGKMAVRILAEDEDISKMPIEYTSNFTKKYNPKVCKQLGIEVPKDYVPLDSK